MKRNLLLAAAVMAALVCLGHAAQAQTIYRSVDAQGRAVFSDQPPPASAGKTGTFKAGSASDGGGGLPYELSQVANRYPVTLYTGADCAPCSNGRAYLSSRGVPFSEKTVTTNDDIEALRRLSSDASLPMLTIGGQHLKGFSSAEWSQYLDAAGYPASSQLPPGYRPAEATPLVAARPASAAPARPATASPNAVEPTAPANPTGIRF